MLVSGGDGPVSLAINGNVGFVAVGYNEGMSGVKLFDKRYPSQWGGLMHADRFRTYGHVATDGQRVYAATTSQSCWGAPCPGQLVAVDLTLPNRYCEHNFTEGGVAVCQGCRCNSSGCAAATDPAVVAAAFRQRANGGANNGWDGCSFSFQLAFACFDSSLLVSTQVWSCQFKIAHCNSDLLVSTQDCSFQLGFARFNSGLLVSF